MIATKKRVLKFNPSHLVGTTYAQEAILEGRGVCSARYGTRAVSATPCDAPVVWLSQDGRRRWVISGFCEVHGGLTKEMNEREGAWCSWARLADVLPEVKKLAEVSK